MAITRKNKFDNVVQELESQEELAQEHSHKVVSSIVGNNGKTRLVTDKNGRVREIKIKEKRKPFMVYLPESVYSQLSDVLETEGKTRNGLIEQLIREYLSLK